MPLISYFFGIRIRMFWDDHSPPHFHAFYQGIEATFSIESGEKIRGTNFPKNAERIVSDWAKKHKDELSNNWELLENKGHPNRIQGADQ
ncbi:MAG: DUF4160 domain-containing protein [Bacteriovoracales bacterium]|nr:DUF4160 domain-containing protein [Bacteriovoracales bacterium]